MLVSWTRKKMEILEVHMLKDKLSQSRPHVRMGEIYYANLGCNIGSEIDKERPVLIFQSESRFVRRSMTAIVIPISNTDPGPYRVPMTQTDLVDGNGVSGSIIVQQMRSISKARISKYVGKISLKKMREVGLEVYNLLYKSTPLLSDDEEGDEQTVPKDAAKNDAETAIQV